MRRKLNFPFDKVFLRFTICGMTNSTLRTIAITVAATVIAGLVLDRLRSSRDATQ